MKMVMVTAGDEIDYDGQVEMAKSDSKIIIFDSDNKINRNIMILLQ